MDRRGAIFDGRFAAVTADQDGAGGQQLAGIVLEDFENRVGNGGAGLVINQAHNAVDRLVLRVGL